MLGMASSKAQRYNILNDPDELDKFVNWLPPLVEGQKFYFCLLARSKYDTTGAVNQKDNQMARFLCRRDNIHQKIRQLEVDYGLYTSRDNVVPQGALALYCLPNPRSLRKATKQVLREGLEWLMKDDPNERFNIHSEALSCIQRASGGTYMVDFDFDGEEAISLLSEFDLDDYLGPQSYDIIKTRGGVHLLVKPKFIHKDFAGYQKWHREFSAIADTARLNKNESDKLLPVAGCTQGGIVPKFITAEELKTETWSTF